MKPFKDTYVMYQLLEFINESGIIVLCKASKKLNEICKQYIEMEDDNRFEVNVKLFEDYCRNNHIVRLLKLVKILEKIGDFDYFDWEDGLEYACRGGHMDIIKLIIEKGAQNWHCGFHGACLGDHIDIVKFLIKKGFNDWNGGLSYACYDNNLDIVKLMIKKGANNWNYALRYACEGGNIDIVKLIM